MGVGPAAAVKIAASESLSAFHLAKYRFTLCATTEIILPVYKGSATHGGFGHALQHISPAFFKMLYQPPGKDSPPKPFVLTPPLASKTDYQPGEQFEIELVLIGNATQHLPVCFAALDALGQQLGFGTNKGRYQIERVDFCDASGDYQPLFQGGIWQFGHNQPSPSACRSDLEFASVLEPQPNRRADSLRQPRSGIARTADCPA